MQKRAFAEIVKTGAKVDRIFLSPLELSSVTQLISDALNCPEARVKSLAELVFFKTGGNPFFMNEFLRSLYTEGLLQFHFTSGAVSDIGATTGGLPLQENETVLGTQGDWQWNLEEIKARNFTDNVVELMAGKIQQLSDKTQKILKIAACIGNQFDLKTLASLCQNNLEETADELYAAVAEGTVNEVRIKVLPSIPIESCPELCEAVINYVARTKENVVLNDATRAGNFTKDS